MFNHVLQSETVRKLKTLINERFQRDLLIQSMLPVDSQEMDGLEFKVISGDLVIPIWVQNRYFATAKVPKISGFSGVEQEAITSLVKLILEPTFYGWYLGQLADNARAAVKYDVMMPMRPVVLLSESQSLSASAEAVDTASLISNYLFLESKNPHEVLKAAAQIHDLTSNWASVRFNDIATETTSVDEILAMGNITLVIEDILNLSPVQRLLILQLLRNPRKTEGPFIMLGSSSALEDLEADDMIPKDLAVLFKNQRLNIDRLPADRKKREDIYEMLLGPAVHV